MDEMTNAFKFVSQHTQQILILNLIRCLRGDEAPVGRRQPCGSGVLMVTQAAAERCAGYTASH